MSLATHSNLNRVQLLHSLLTFVILGLVLWPCNAHYNYYNKTNGKGRMSSMGHVKGYGKGRGGGGGGGSSNVHVMQSKGHRNTTSVNGSATMSDEPTAPPSKITMTDEPTAPPSKVTMTDNPTAPPSKVPTAENPTALPSKKTNTNDPTAPPSKATMTDKPTAPPSKVVMTDKPATPPLQVTLTDEPTAPPSTVTMTDEPTAPPSKLTMPERPTAPPSKLTMLERPTALPPKATCIVPSSTKARVCFLFDSTNEFLSSGIRAHASMFAEALLNEINTTSPESLYSIVSFGSGAKFDLINSDAPTTLNTLYYRSFLYGTQSTHWGFKKCEETFSFTNGKSNVIILFTNGGTDNSTLADDAVNAAKARDIKIVCLGIGSGIDFDTLYRWSSSSELTFTTYDYVENKGVSDEFLNLIKCD